MRLCCGILILFLIPAVAAAQVTIVRNPVVIERKTFDPKNRPAEMPKLNPDESAVTQSYFGADTRVAGTVTPAGRDEAKNETRVAIKVESIRMTLQTRVTIWLPTNAVAKITVHEEGHLKLAEHFYRDAEAIARGIASKMIGQTITGVGENTDAAADNALKEAAQLIGGKYLDQTDVPCGKAQEYYDQITGHGTNAVDEKVAIQKAIERVNAEMKRREE
jgi:hypothetical protein